MKKRIELTEAVIPIIRLLLMTAAFMGTFMWAFMAKTFSTPPPTPKRAPKNPARHAEPNSQRTNESE